MKDCVDPATVFALEGDGNFDTVQAGMSREKNKMNAYRLIIGDYAKSSWSMRAWLVLKATGVAFETVQVRLDQADTRANILRYSPAGKVPALILKDCVINDSLAIGETIVEKFPQAEL